jgi:hypothetical protein
MKNNRLFALAVLVLALGGWALVNGTHNFAIRSMGDILILVSMYLLSKSRGQSASVSVDTADSLTHSKPTNRPGPLMWIISAAMVPLVGTSYLLLRNDAARGGNQVWPVYLFAGLMVVAGSFWSALVARLI